MWPQGKLPHASQRQDREENRAATSDAAAEQPVVALGHVSGLLDPAGGLAINEVSTLYFY
jgi:hypothetical protein